MAGTQLAIIAEPCGDDFGKFRQLLLGAACVAAVVAGAATTAQAAERLCDPAYEDCRALLLNYIRNETVGIDVAFWFMEDTRYTDGAHQPLEGAGVPVRVIVDPRANPTYPRNADEHRRLRQRRHPDAPTHRDGGILHWKTMLFAGQSMSSSDGANYSRRRLRVRTPYRELRDESIYFTDDPSIVNSFMTEVRRPVDRHDELRQLREHHRPADPQLPDLPEGSRAELPAAGGLRDRAILKRYNAETQKIDVIMFRITDERHTDAMIAAMQRGVPVRHHQRDRTSTAIPSGSGSPATSTGCTPPAFRCACARHAGLNHQKLVLLYSQGMSVFGSSNWTTPVDQPAAGAQLLHDQARGCSSGSRPVRAQVEQHGAGRRDRDRAVRAAAARQAGLQSPANAAVGAAALDRAEVGRRPLGAALRRLLRHRSEPAALCRQPAARAQPIRRSRRRRRSWSCRCCSTARPTTGASCRRRWPA